MSEPTQWGDGHSSRLGCLVIDCRTEDLTEACNFWSGVLGKQGRVTEGGRYVEFDGHSGYPKILLQAVDHDPRVHLDFETDDQEAERVRVEALGAREVARVRHFIVMEAPTGHRFCITPPEDEGFPPPA